MPFTIEGKVALVTGGALAIGLAFVKELLKNGAKGVALVDINSVKGQEARQEVTKEFGINRCIFIECDVAQHQQFEDAFKETIEFFKQLDIVINNAGIFNERDWQRCLAVNLGGSMSGTILAVDKYLPKYSVDKEGVVINISSIFGVDPLYICPAYSTSKGGVIALTRAYGSQEHYHRTNVRVVALCPGYTESTLMITSKERETDWFCSMLHPSLAQSERVLQTPQHVAESLIRVIKESKGGSVWVVKNSEPAYEVPYSEKIESCTS